MSQGCQLWARRHPRGPGLGAEHYPKALGRRPQGIQVGEEDWGAGRDEVGPSAPGEHTGLQKVGAESWPRGSGTNTPRPGKGRGKPEPPAESELGDWRATRGATEDRSKGGWGSREGLNPEKPKGGGKEEDKEG